MVVFYLKLRCLRDIFISDSSLNFKSKFNTMQWTFILLWYSNLFNILKISYCLYKQRIIIWLFIAGIVLFVLYFLKWPRNWTKTSWPLFPPSQKCSALSLNQMLNQWLRRRRRIAIVLCAQIIQFLWYLKRGYIKVKIRRKSLF